MDKYAIELYEQGVFATIGKGERKEEVDKYIHSHNKMYFTMIGGAASFHSQAIKECQIIAYEDLGAEAIYKLKVNKLLVTVS